MKILWIDDDPDRGHRMPPDIQASITWAHGFDQICWYLNHPDNKTRENWDLILLDHDMPLMDGMKVCKQFLHERNIPVLIISSNEPAARQMEDFLKEWYVPVTRIPITNWSRVIIWLRDFELRLLLKAPNI